jgi:hypothetical protein
MAKEIAALPETTAYGAISSFLEQRASAPPSQVAPSAIPTDKVAGVMDSIFATFHMHRHSRIASMCGEVSPLV